MKKERGLTDWILRKVNERGNRTKRAFVLLYTMILLTILIVMLSSLLSYTLFISKDYIADRGRETLIRNLESAVTLMLDPEFMKENNRPLTISLFGQEGDSVTVRRSQWGFYSLIYVSGTTTGYCIDRVCLCGDFKYSENSPALELYDCYKPLCISGNTFIRGNILIPEAGLKSAQIDGKFYTREHLSIGNVISVNKKMPEIKELIVNMDSKSLLSSAGEDVKYVIYNDEVINDTLVCSFLDEAVFLHASGPLTLSNCYIQGRVIIQCDTMVAIMNNAHINDAIIMAKYICIESGFKGTGQFIATDSLVCGQTCTFLFPSVLALINQSNSPDPFLLIADHCCIFGTVLGYTRMPMKKYTHLILFSKESTLTGSLYSNRNSCIMGNIHGNVATTGLYYRTHSGLYDNYLVDAVIDHDMQREYYSGFDFRKNNKFLNILEWLY